MILNKNNKTLLLLGSAFIFIILILILIISNKDTVPKEVQVIEYLKNIKAYTCDVNIKTSNIKQNIEYKGMQKFSKKHGFLLELENGRTFKYDSENLYVNDFANNEEYVISSEFDDVLKYLFTGEFISLLYSNGDINYSLEDEQGSQYLAIEVRMPGNNKNINKGKLYVDINTGIPKECHILDDKGKEKVICSYTNFVELKDEENFEFNER